MMWGGGGGDGGVAGDMDFSTFVLLVNIFIYKTESKVL